MKCRLIPLEKYDCYMNMAIDEVLLHKCEGPIVRLYQWNSPAITVGYNQNVNKEIDRAKCDELDIPIVRRITGGKAVLHDTEVTYSFVVPESLTLLSKEVNESYKEIAQALIYALKKIGITASIQKVPENVSTAVCFNSANWYELTINDKKISGSAQRRVDKKILQHGPILDSVDFVTNGMVFNTDPKNAARQNDFSHAGSRKCGSRCGC